MPGMSCKNIFFLSHNPDRIIQGNVAKHQFIFIHGPKVSYHYITQTRFNINFHYIVRVVANDKKQRVKSGSDSNSESLRFPHAIYCQYVFALSHVVDVNLWKLLFVVGQNSANFHRRQQCTRVCTYCCANLHETNSQVASFA